MTLPTNNENYSVFPQFLKDFKPEIDLALFQFMQGQSKRLQEIWPYISPLVPHLVEFVRREGKRIRPSLTMLGYEAFGGQDRQAILLPAIGSELMHDSFIIHDDLYDAIPGTTGTRRGLPVLHERYQAQFESSPTANDSNWDSELFSKHATVAVAHVLLALGAKTIFDSPFSSDLKIKAHSLYWQTIEETWIGQGMDILSKGKPLHDIDDHEILQTEESRAGLYTVAFPLQLGATLAGADEMSLQQLSTYGRNAGLAFEIYDDVLAIFGQEDDIGKVQADLAEGKRTLLLERAFAKGTKRERAIISTILQERTPNQRAVFAFKEIVEKTGTLAFTLKLVTELIEQAEIALETLPLEEKYKNDLRHLARFTINRTR